MCNKKKYYSINNIKLRIAITYFPKNTYFIYSYIFLIPSTNLVIFIYIYTCKFKSCINYASPRYQKRCSILSCT